MYSIQEPVCSTARGFVPKLTKLENTRACKHFSWRVLEKFFANYLSKVSNVRWWCFISYKIPTNWSSFVSTLPELIPCFISGSQSTISYPYRHKSARARDKNVSVNSSMVHFKFDIDFRGIIRAQLFDREFRFENTAFVTQVFYWLLKYYFSAETIIPEATISTWNLKREVNTPKIIPTVTLERKILS